jgi:hypothetical protein
MNFSFLLHFLLAQKVNKKGSKKSKFELALYPHTAPGPVNSNFAHFSGNHRTDADLQLSS